MRHTDTCRGWGAAARSCGLPVEGGLERKECGCCRTCWGEESWWSWRTDEAQEEQYAGQLVVQKRRLMVGGASLKPKHKPPSNLESPPFLLRVIPTCASLPAGELR